MKISKATQGSDAIKSSEDFNVATTTQLCIAAKKNAETYIKSAVQSLGAAIRYAKDDAEQQHFREVLANLSVVLFDLQDE